MGKTSKKTNDGVKANIRNGAEYLGSEPLNAGNSESPRPALADSAKDSPRRECTKMAESQVAESSNRESTSTKHPLSPPGPAKSQATEGKLEISPPREAELAHMFGTSNLHLCHRLLLQATRASPQEPDDPMGMSVVAALAGISPRDTLEGMLATQIVATHNQSMEFFRRAALPGLPLDVVERYVNLGMKLHRTYIPQMEALDRHRGKGEQKMNVGASAHP